MTFRVTLELECGCRQTFEQDHTDTLPGAGEARHCAHHGDTTIRRASRVSR